MMNYIELVNTFWALNKEYSFTPNEKALYFAILNKCNELGWKNPFNQSNAYLAMDSGMSESAMQKARNTLQQKNLISFASGDGRRNNTVYTVNVVNAQKGNTKGNFKNNLSDTLSDTLYGTLSDTLSDENRTDNNKLKTKLKETKEREPVTPDPTDPNLATPGMEKKKRVREPFVPPTREEMRAYFQKVIGEKWGEVRAKFSADTCYDHYKGNGWIQGKNKPIVDWKSAANNWVRREISGEFSPAPQSQSQPKHAAPLPIKPPPPPPVPVQLTAKEKEGLSDSYINDLYADYLDGSLRAEFMSASGYDHLKAAGKLILSEEDGLRIKALARNKRLLQLTQSNEENEKSLAVLYREKPDSDQVKADGPIVLRMAKNIALLEYFEKCKIENVKKIF